MKPLHQTPSQPLFQRDWFRGVILMVMVFAVYQPVWHAGFIWDDDMHLTANPVIVGPLGLMEIWTTSAARICPLTLTTFWFEHTLWGLSPLPYHLVNVLLHAASALILWRILQNLRVPFAWWGAALWALHPVQVESVAWITELKNTQSGLFYLLSIFFFVKWLTVQPGAVNAGRNYGLALLFALLAMLSKSSTVILPLVLGLCAWWMDGRWSWRRFIAIAPFFLFSIALSILSIWTQKLDGGLDLAAARTWPERLATAGDIVWFYLGKLFWPHPLIFFYPRWQIDASAWISYLPLLFLLMVMGALWCYRSSAFRPIFFASTYFLIALLPVLGLVDHYFLRYSFVGDHFQYLANMGPLALAGAGLAWFTVSFPRLPGLPAVLGTILLCLLGFLSWQRSWIYLNDEVLWADTINRNPKCQYAYLNLGYDLFKKERTKDAIVLYRKALEIDPHFAFAYNNLGNALLREGHVDEAITNFQRGIEINPGYAEAMDNLGTALAEKGSIDEAISLWRKNISLNPRFPTAYYNFANALLQQGKLDEAIVLYRKVIELTPRNFEPYVNLGAALSRKGQEDEAITQYRTAFALEPRSTIACYNLGNLLLSKGNVDEALSLLQKAILLDPGMAAAHNSLGTALAQKGELAQALSQFAEAVRLDSSNQVARDNLAKVTALLQPKKNP